MKSEGSLREKRRVSQDTEGKLFASMDYAAEEYDELYWKS
jgi:hypothetical protein